MILQRKEQNFLPRNSINDQLLLPPNLLEKLTDGTREEKGDPYLKKRGYLFTEIDAMIKYQTFMDGQIDQLLLKNQILNQQTKQMDHHLQLQKKIDSLECQQKNRKEGIHNIQQKSSNVSQKKKNQMQKLKSTKNDDYLFKINNKTLEEVNRQDECQELIKNKTKKNLQNNRISVTQGIKQKKLYSIQLCQNFNTLDAFKVLDVYKKGSFGVEEIDILLIQNLGQCQQIFARFQTNQLTYHDFLNLLQSYSINITETLNIIQISIDINHKKISQFLSIQTIRLFIEQLNLLQQIPVKLIADIQLFNKIDRITRDNFLRIQIYLFFIRNSYNNFYMKVDQDIDILKQYFLKILMIKAKMVDYRYKISQICDFFNRLIIKKYQF